MKQTQETIYTVPVFELPTEGFYGIWRSKAAVDHSLEILFTCVPDMLLMSAL